MKKLKKSSSLLKKKFGNFLKNFCHKNAIKMLRGVIFDRFSDDPYTRLLPEGTRYPGSKCRVIPVPDPDPRLSYPDPTRNRQFATRSNTTAFS